MGASSSTTGLSPSVEPVSAVSPAGAASIPSAFVLVPLDAPEAMWDGLPRQIMMWLGFERPTARALFEHLRHCGYDVPDWMREEGELNALDHVPSKGTRCVLIYRAMVENWLASGIAARSDETPQAAQPEARARPDAQPQPESSHDLLR